MISLAHTSRKRKIYLNTARNVCNKQKRTFKSYYKMGKNKLSKFAEIGNVANVSK